jgi:hypothetical protein
MMIFLKGLILAGVLASGLIAVLNGSDSSSDAKTGAYYPDASLPTLFQPMKH